MERIAVLGTDTPHRRYIINSLIDLGFNITDCLFQAKNLSPPFETTAVWQARESDALLALFQAETRQDLDRVSVHYVEDLNDKNTQEYIAAKRPSFFIVSGAGKLKGKTLQRIAENSLNVHIGYAEQYRGLDSNLWALYHGDYAHIGVTLHRLSASLDAGDIIEQTALPLSSDISVITLRYHESRLAVSMLNRALSAQRQGKLNARKQTTFGRYYSFMPACLKDQIEHKLPHKLGKTPHG